MEHRRTLLRIVALALLLYALASLLTVRRELARAEALCRTLGGEILQLQQERRDLEAALAAYGQEQEMRRLAWERLGMVAPGERVYLFPQETEESSASVWDDG